MKQMFFFFLCCIFCFTSFSQFYDTFSDSDFTNNPTWTVGSGIFEVDSLGQLHLNDTIANKAYICTESQSIMNGSWEMDVKLGFSPSSSNYAKIYLVSDQQNISSNLNGYFIKIGGQSGNVDEVGLYVQNGSSTTKIIDGTDGIAATNPELKIKVTRDAIGNWELFLDTAGNYFSEGTAFEKSFTASNYFGVVCEYTITRADLFWFDNFNVSGTFLMDTIKPEISSTSISSSNSVVIEFSEMIDTISVQNTNNYIINNGIGNPNTIHFINGKTVEVFFTNSFVSTNNYTLNISNIEDLEQNIMLSFDTTFTYFLVSYNDIIINEIFADPTPTLALPEYEYLELFNNKQYSIDLTDWQLNIGTSLKLLPPCIIAPDSFLLVADENVLDSFPDNIAKIGISSLSLTNTGDEIVLQDLFGKTINAVSYTDKWYKDNNKRDGGWSLERIDPLLTCEGINNWAASIDNSGGTPGKQNSLVGKQVQLDVFRIVQTIITDSNKITIWFNKSLDSLLLSDNTLYQVNSITPQKSTALPPFFDAVVLSFNFLFSPKISYLVSTNGLTDCAGNLLSNTFSFGVPDSATEGDIVINEILFNPKEDGVDFVEIYNPTASFFDLSELKIANFFVLGNQLYPSSAKTITENPFLLAPYSYLVLTTDSAKVKSQYICKYPFHFIELESMPSMNADSGNICLVSNSLNQIIDAFSYSEDMHFSLLESVDGVSLERLSPLESTQNSSNWHSAASTIGYATPTYANSQEFVTQSTGSITIDPQLFSPNNDGYKDFCAIHWDFQLPNLVATIQIFDSNGKSIATLLHHQMIGTSGFISWDGFSDDGILQNTGKYIVWMEVFSENGNVEQYKKVIVLSR